LGRVKSPKNQGQLAQDSSSLILDADVDEEKKEEDEDNTPQSDTK
jgi:hypothetical protein